MHSGMATSRGQANNGNDDEHTHKSDDDPQSHADLVPRYLSARNRMGSFCGLIESLWLHFHRALLIGQLVSLIRQRFLSSATREIELTWRRGESTVNSMSLCYRRHCIFIRHHGEL
jgi:hypothetical protein